MKNYSLEENNNILDKNSSVFIETTYDKDKIIQVTKNLNRGYAFNGFTPMFFGKSYNKGTNI